MPQVTMILSNGAILLPAVVAVGVPGPDRAVFAVAVGDQAVVERAGALSERRDDLDRPDVRREVRQIGGLVARAGADLENLVGPPDGERIRHAGDRVRAGNGDAEADVEVMPFIGAVDVLRRHEFFARGQEIGADVGVVPDVVVGDDLLEAVPALAKKARVLAAVFRPSTRQRPRASHAAARCSSHRGSERWPRRAPPRPQPPRRSGILADPSPGLHTRRTGSEASRW